MLPLFYGIATAPASSDPRWLTTLRFSCALRSTGVHGAEAKARCTQLQRTHVVTGQRPFPETLQRQLQALVRPKAALSIHHQTRRSYKLARCLRQYSTAAQHGTPQALYLEAVTF